MAMLLGCSADDAFVTDVELEPRCGDEAPVKLLDLAEDEVVGEVASFDGEAFVVDVLVGSDADGYARRSVVVSDCGDDAQEVAANLHSVFVWEGALLGCDADRNLVQPNGVRDPTPEMLVRRGCDRVHTDSAIVTYEEGADAGIGRLVAIRSNGDGTVEIETLADGVVVVGDPSLVYRPLVQDEVAYVRMPDLSVHAVELASGTNVLLIADVVSAQISRSHILYQSASAVQQDLAPLVLRERKTGSEVVLDNAFPTNGDRVLSENYVRLHGAAGTPTLTGPRWFWTSDGREFFAPGGTAILSVLPDDSAWLSRYDDVSYEQELLRWREAELPERVVSCQDCLDMSHDVRRGGVHIRRGRDFSGDAELWFARDAGGDPELLASRITSDYAHLADDRVLTVVDREEDRGTLVLHDYRDPAEQVLDPQVRTTSIFLTLLFDRQDDVFFEVDDAERRHALYHARLAPAP
jgi:hypothetical protein